MEHHCIVQFLRIFAEIVFAFIWLVLILSVRLETYIRSCAIRQEHGQIFHDTFINYGVTMGYVEKRK